MAVDDRIALPGELLDAESRIDPDRGAVLLDESLRERVDRRDVALPELHEPGNHRVHEPTAEPPSQRERPGKTIADFAGCVPREGD